MLEVSVELVARVGALLVFLFAAAAAVTNRRAVDCHRRGVFMGVKCQRGGAQMDCRLGRGL